MLEKGLQKHLESIIHKTKIHALSFQKKKKDYPEIKMIAPIWQSSQAY